MNRYLITEYEKKMVSVYYEKDVAMDIEVHAHTTLNAICIAKVKNIVENIAAAFVEVEIWGERELCYYNLKENKVHLYTDEKEHQKLKEGDEIIVQISKEAVKTKAPMASAHICMTGRYCVVSLGHGEIRFSSKIRDQEWKNQIREEISHFPLEEIQILCRTNAYQISAEKIYTEAKKLGDKLLNLLRDAKYKSAPTLLQAPTPGYMTSMQKLKEEDIEIVTDLPKVYQEIKEYLLEQKSPMVEGLKLYKDEMISLCALYGLKSLFAEALSKKVWLKSGGYLVIEPTEALTVIDVNTGKTDVKMSKEETIQRTNREAALMAARQLRLRNISGIILIDFIDMTDSQHRREIFELLSRELKKDRVKAVAVDFTSLHLAEMTRQKLRPTLFEQWRDA